MGGTEITGDKEQAHICIHEEDLKQTKKDVKDIKTELEKGNNLFTYITEELEIVKDAIGVKSKENGDRDLQIQEIRQRANEIGEKAEEKDETLFNKVHGIEVSVAEIKGTLGLNKQKQENKLKTWHIILAILGAFILGLFLDLIKYYTSFL